MGQIKNIKLHIVTDIKCTYNMKSMMGDYSSRRSVVIIAFLLVIIGLGFLYSFHRQNAALFVEHEALTVVLDKCERAHQQCRSDVTVCKSETSQLQDVKTQTVKQLKDVQAEAAKKEQDLLSTKNTADDLKKQLETARADTITITDTLEETKTKLSENEKVILQLVSTVNSNIDVDTITLTPELINETLNDIIKLKEDIKIVSALARATHPPPPPEVVVKTTAAPQPAAPKATEASKATEAVKVSEVPKADEAPKVTEPTEAVDEVTSDAPVVQ